jgi:hypothetical protein
LLAASPSSRGSGSGLTMENLSLEKRPLGHDISVDVDRYSQLDETIRTDRIRHPSDRMLQLDQSVSARL